MIEIIVYACKAYRLGVVDGYAADINGSSVGSEDGIGTLERMNVYRYS